MVSTTDMALADPVVHDGYRVVIEPTDDRIRVVFNGETVAESTRTLLMHETRLPSVYYFPLADVRSDFLLRNELRTHCSFKGNASYWSLKAGDRSTENAVWSYEDPYDETSSIGGYVAFDWSAMDAWFVGEEEIAEQRNGEVQATENPFSDSWKATSAADFVARLAVALVAAEFPGRLSCDAQPIFRLCRGRHD